MEQSCREAEVREVAVERDDGAVISHGCLLLARGVEGAEPEAHVVRHPDLCHGDRARWSFTVASM